jgi:hypothetical protein
MEGRREDGQKPVYTMAQQEQQQQQEQSLPRVATLSEIEEVLSSEGNAYRLVDANLEGFVSFSRGDFNAPPIQTMDPPPMAPFGCSPNMHQIGIPDALLHSNSRRGSF